MERQKYDIFYTTIDIYDNKEQRINIHTYDKDVTIEFPSKVNISNQQLAELGHLFIALAGSYYDEDSIGELLDGYGIEIQKWVLLYGKTNIKQFLHEKLLIAWVELEICEICNTYKISLQDAKNNILDCIQSGAYTNTLLSYEDETILCNYLKH
jgi:hypothetical protein